MFNGLEFRFSDSFKVDLEEEPWSREGLRVGIYALPGHGKSYMVAATLVEPFLEQGGTTAILEPKRRDLNFTLTTILANITYAYFENPGCAD